MARRKARLQPDRALGLPALSRICPACGGPLRAAWKTNRSVTTLTARSGCLAPRRFNPGERGIPTRLSAERIASTAAAAQ